MFPRNGLVTMGGIFKGKMEKEADNVGFLFPHLYEGICIKDLPQRILPVLTGKGSKDLSSLQACRAPAVRPHSASLMPGRM